jgi:hypothetical protein
MSNIRIGIPKVSGQHGVPEPSDSNDVIVWKALICKFMCIENNNRFSKSSFLTWIIKEKIQSVGAYDKDEIKNATHDNNHTYSRLIRFCLDSLVKIHLLCKSERIDTNRTEYEEYMRTERLKIFCPEIERYDMPVVDELIKSVLDAETEIRADKHFSAIVNLLINLKEKKQIQMEDAKDIDEKTLTKLNQLGVITISFNNQVTISPLSEKFMLYVTTNH